MFAQGNVEIYYNNYILTADEVIYGGANTLVATGNAQLKELNGHVTRADRFDMPDDFRDAFVLSLRTTIQDGAHLPDAPR